MKIIIATTVYDRLGNLQCAFFHERTTIPTPDELADIQMLVMADGESAVSTVSIETVENVLYGLITEVSRHD